VSVPTALVTGAGRGIGRAAVLAFLDAGWRAVAGVRDAASSRAGYAEHEALRVVPLDVTDPGAVRDGVAAAEAHAGGALAAVVNNAGYGVAGAQEDADLDAVRAMFETNLFGAAAVTQAALPAMRRAGRGTVVYVSSIGGRITNPLFGFYHATKYGMGALAEALAQEGRPYGIRAALVEPGMVGTGFRQAVRVTGTLVDGEGPYAGLWAELQPAMAAWRARHETPAEVVAAAIVAAARDPDGPFRVPVGGDTDLLAAARAERGDEAWQEWFRGFLELDWPRR
jgi:NAD(P)-dependent dehydrogenase (short-subunit alcohol dehydrogenase family)